MMGWKMQHANCILICDWKEFIGRERESRKVEGKGGLRLCVIYNQIRFAQGKLTSFQLTIKLN